MESLQWHPSKTTYPFRLLSSNILQNTDLPIPFPKKLENTETRLSWDSGEIPLRRTINISILQVTKLYISTYEDVNTSFIYSICMDGDSFHKKDNKYQNL